MEERLVTVPTSDLNLDHGYFVPAHPLFQVLVPYGLYLTFASFICPEKCLPGFLPLAPLAIFLGTNFNLLMGIISAIAAALHVGEAVQAFFLASLQYNLNPLVVLLWTLNVFFFGIFGFWPLAFPQVFQDNKATYCSLPGSLCFNTDLQ